MPMANLDISELVSAVENAYKSEPINFVGNIDADTIKVEGDELVFVYFYSGARPNPFRNRYDDIRKELWLTVEKGAAPCDSEPSEMRIPIPEGAEKLRVDYAETLNPELFSKLKRPKD